MDSFVNVNGFSIPVSEAVRSEVFDMARQELVEELVLEISGISKIANESWRPEDDRNRIMRRVNRIIGILNADGKDLRWMLGND